MYDNASLEFTSDSSATSPNSFVREEYIKDFFIHPLDKSIIQFRGSYSEYPLEKPDLYQENLLYLFQLDRYSDEFLKKVIWICIQDPSQWKDIRYITFIDKDWKRYIRVYSL